MMMMLLLLLASRSRLAMVVLQRLAWEGALSRRQCFVGWFGENWESQRATEQKKETDECYKYLEMKEYLERYLERATAQFSVLIQ